MKDDWRRPPSFLHRSTEGIESEGKLRLAFGSIFRCAVVGQRCSLQSLEVSAFPDSFPCDGSLPLPHHLCEKPMQR